MTRKQALIQVINLLSSDTNNAEIVRLFQDIYDELPLIHWSDKSIRDTIDQFIIDNGRVPTATDFKKRGMPPHPVFKQKYGITLAEWLKQNYPSPKPSREEQRKEFTQRFIEDYCDIQPRTSEEFNARRKEGTRSWQSIASYHKVTSWRKLIQILNLPLYSPLPLDRENRVSMQFKVRVHSDYNFTDNEY